METKIIQENDIDSCASLLLKGEVVAFPTETVYGVGVIATKEEAFNADQAKLQKMQGHALLDILLIWEKVFL